jgi:hypothetical protein
MLARQLDGVFWTAVSKLDAYEQVIEKLTSLPILVVVGSELQPEELSAVA